MERFHQSDQSVPVNTLSGPVMLPGRDGGPPTFQAKVSLSESPSVSVTVTVMEPEPAASGVPESCQAVSETSVAVNQVGRPENAKSWGGSPSVVRATSSETGSSTFQSWSSMSSRAGVRSGCTVQAKDSSSESPSVSVTVTVMEPEPAASGVPESRRAVSETSVAVNQVGRPENAKSWGGSPSVVRATSSETGSSTFQSWSSMSSTTGFRSGWTVQSKGSLSESPSASVTVTVMEPEPAASGVPESRQTVSETFEAVNQVGRPENANAWSGSPSPSRVTSSETGSPTFQSSWSSMPARAGFRSGCTVQAKVSSSESPSVSVTVTVMEPEPAASGVPESRRAVSETSVAVNQVGRPENAKSWGGSPSVVRATSSETGSSTFQSWSSMSARTGFRSTVTETDAPTSWQNV